MLIAVEIDKPSLLRGSTRPPLTYPIQKVEIGFVFGQVSFKARIC